MAPANHDDDPRIRSLIAAAYDLLDTAGLEGLTVRAVLAQTGLARRAFYDLLGTKDNLVLAVFAYTLRGAAERLANFPGARPAPMIRLKSIVTAIILGRAGTTPDGSNEGHLRSAALTREHLRLAESKPLELQRAIAPLIDLIARQLAEGMAAGAVRQTDPHRLAALGYNLVSTTMHTELLTEQAAMPDRKRRERLALEVWEFCERAIAVGA